MNGYQPQLPQAADPLEHLYRLERDLENAAERSASLIEELTQRLATLEDRVASLDDSFDSTSRQLERELMSLAERIASLEKARAA